MQSMTILEFSPEEIQRIMRIVLDEDKEEALNFVKECLEKKIKQKSRLFFDRPLLKIRGFEKAKPVPAKSPDFHKKGRGNHFFCQLPDKVVNDVLNLNQVAP